MKHIWVILMLGFIISNLCSGKTTDTIPANDPLIEYTGRIDFKNPLTPRFSYSGVSIRACFSGSSIGVILNDNVGSNYYNVILDGALLDSLHAVTGKKLYPIAADLENKIHEIEIFKRTEEMFGKTEFFGFVVDEGSSLSAITNTRSRLIEFIGNSITCGYGNEGVNGGTFGPTTENHYLTYAAFTSRNFNARHLAVCKSGIGIYRNYDGPAIGNPDCMTNYYTRIYLWDENPTYAFKEKPDLICIDLGTNDFSTSGGDSAKFVSNYFRFIDTLQTKYSMPDILCLLGPMMSDPTLSKVRRYLKYIADSASMKGKGNVNFFEMSAQTGSLGIGIDYHPTVAQHKKNGMELTDYIKGLKGWKITPLVINANLVETKHIKLEFNTAMDDSLEGFSGFSVSGDGQEYAIDSISADVAEPEIIHIWLNFGMSIGEKITLNYVPGTIMSYDSVKLDRINLMTIQNNLTETRFIKGTVGSDGRSIVFICNKSIQKPSSLDGLTLNDTRGTVAIDSFGISKTQLTVYLNDIILKGDSAFATYTGDALTGVDGVPLNNFTKLILKNNSTYTWLAHEEENVFSVYPNPSSGIFNIHLRGYAVYSVTDITGNRIASGTLSDSMNAIDLSESGRGLYLLMIRKDDGLSLVKLIVI
jgi:hypothetical protein